MEAGGSRSGRGERFEELTKAKCFFKSKVTEVKEILLLITFRAVEAERILSM